MFFILQLIPNLNRTIRRIKSIGNLGAGLYCSVSIYYLLYVFIDTTNDPYPEVFYEIAFITLSIVSSFLIYKIFKFFEEVKEENRKKQIANDKFVKTSLELLGEINKTIT